jgi:hypothetical protein
MAASNTRNNKFLDDWTKNISPYFNYRHNDSNKIEGIILKRMEKPQFRKLAFHY